MIMAFDVPASQPINVDLKSNNPHFAYSNTERRGYGVVKATANKLEVEFRSPMTTEQPKSPVETIQAFEVASGVQLV